MIETTVCSKCGATYSCRGSSKKEYRRATVFVPQGNTHRPVCRDKEACESRVLKGETDAYFFWDKVKTGKRGRPKMDIDDE